MIWKRRQYWQLLCQLLYSSALWQWNLHGNLRLHSNSSVLFEKHCTMVIWQRGYTLCNRRYLCSGNSIDIIFLFELSHSYSTSYLCLPGDLTSSCLGRKIGNIEHNTCLYAMDKLENYRCFDDSASAIYTQGCTPVSFSD